PICVLLDVYSQATLAELKAAGVFRNGFLWRRWVEALYDRNRWAIRLIVAFIFTQTVATVVFSGPGVNHFLQSRCLQKQSRQIQAPHASSIGILIVLLFWLLGSLPGLLFAAAGLFRKERFRRQVGYPSRPRRSYIDLLPWLVPCAVSLPTAVFLMWVYIDTERSCRVFENLIYPASGCATKVLLLTVLNL
uniref:G_PROTEIN_RECEP_F1_2 domain-containing protein n=1 Tax=Macrostomum lignano TaxID=282301 RepID=A0A1I8J5T3_9PLAT